MKRANNSIPAHHRPGGGFLNPWPSSAPHGFGGFLKWVTSRSQRKPLGAREPISSKPSGDGVAKAESPAVTWIGHSTFLLKLPGMNVLTDPIWSDRASPVSFAGPRRFTPPGIPLEKLPEIHVTLLSHDHYDHLDDATVRHLIARFPSMQWFVPLGVKDFLTSRGASSVIELDWWDDAVFQSATFRCTPAQHFSGRFPWNRNATLWCGWVVQTTDRRIFFAGDTALHPEFAEIARRFGPFDVSILPIGAYDPRWFMGTVHMDPDQAVRAFTDLQTAGEAPDSVMIGSHWGTFRLTDEPIDEPPVLARQSWAAAGLPADRLWILSPGDTRTLK